MAVAKTCESHRIHGDRTRGCRHFQHYLLKGSRLSGREPALSRRRGRLLTVHAWTDGSFRQSAGFGWHVTRVSIGQRAKSLGMRQASFDAELSAIAAALSWFNNYLEDWHLVIHSDSTSAIVRANHSGADPG
jgi:hypothetical protein